MIDGGSAEAAGAGAGVAVGLLTEGVDAMVELIGVINVVVVRRCVMMARGLGLVSAIVANGLADFAAVDSLDGAISDVDAL